MVKSNSNHLTNFVNLVIAGTIGGLFSILFQAYIKNPNPIDGVIAVIVVFLLAAFLYFSAHSGDIIRNFKKRRK